MPWWGRVVKFELGLSRRAYAKRRGVTDKAVRKAIGSAQMHGRIWEAVLPDGTIDADLADRLWEGRTDPSQRRGKEALRAEASMAALAGRMAAEEAQPPEEDDAVEEDEDGEGALNGAPVEAPRPVPLNPSDFEEDPPRRAAAITDEQMEAAEALAAHVAANRGKAAAGAAV